MEWAVVRRMVMIFALNQPPSPAGTGSLRHRGLVAQHGCIEWGASAIPLDGAFAISLVIICLHPHFSCSHGQPCLYQQPFTMPAAASAAPSGSPVVAAATSSGPSAADPGNVSVPAADADTTSAVSAHSAATATTATAIDTVYRPFPNFPLEVRTAVFFAAITASHLHHARSFKIWGADLPWELGVRPVEGAKDTFFFRWEGRLAGANTAAALAVREKRRGTVSPFGVPIQGEDDLALLEFGEWLGWWTSENEDEWEEMGESFFFSLFVFFSI
jgi:hypothetical protein